MKSAALFLYGIGVLIVALIALSAEVGSFAKSVLVAATFFAGAMIAAILHLAERMRADVLTREQSDAGAPTI